MTVTRSLVLAAIVGAVVLSGCATGRVYDTPGLAAYFDCVRDQGGLAISAHRSVSSDLHPENSIAAIRATGSAIPGAILELDVARTRDGVLVLMHDETLARTTTGEGRVADQSLQELKAVRLQTVDGAVTDAAPPTLAEALEAVRDVGAIASLDLKPGDAAQTEALARDVITAVREAKAGGRVILITYSAQTARAVAELAPEMSISVSLDDVAGLDSLNPDQVVAWTGTRAPQPELWSALRAREVEVQFGTLGRADRRLDTRYAEDGDLGEYRDLFDKGASIIATDTPLAVFSVLKPEVAKAATCLADQS